MRALGVFNLSYGLPVQRTFRSIAPSISQRQRRSLIARAGEGEIRCYVNEEGHLVCDLLEPGDYVVKGAASEDKNVADEGVAYCYITETGELFCEGLPEGNYTIEKANENQMRTILDRVEKITKGQDIPVPKPITQEISQETFDPETGVRCYVNADGVMVCEKLEPGDYVVKSMKKEGSTPATSEKVTFCYITDDGELICEGIEEGTYHIEKATDDDLSEMLKHVERITQTKGE